MSAKNILIINYIGYPRYLKSYMPDIEIIRMADVLIEKGHNVEILDFATLDFSEKIMNETKKKLGKNIEEKINFYDFNKNESIKANEAFQYAMESAEKTICKNIIEDIRKNSIDIVVFQLEEGRATHSAIRWINKINELFNTVKIFIGGTQVDILKNELNKFLNLNLY